MEHSDFVHLHVHTQYSLLDGAIRLKDLFETAKAYGMPAAAMTDHGNIFGAVSFMNAAKDAGVKPILGCELYICKKEDHRASPEEVPDTLPFALPFRWLVLTIVRWIGRLLSYRPERRP